MYRRVGVGDGMGEGRRCATLKSTLLCCHAQLALPWSRMSYGRRRYRLLPFYCEERVCRAAGGWQDKEVVGPGKSPCQRSSCLGLAGLSLPVVQTGGTGSPLHKSTRTRNVKTVTRQSCPTLLARCTTNAYDAPVGQIICPTRLFVARPQVILHQLGKSR